MPSRWYRLATAAALVSLSVMWPDLSLRGEQSDHLDKPSIDSGPGDSDADPGDDARMSPMGRLAHLAKTGRLARVLEKARGRLADEGGRVSAVEMLAADLDVEDDVEGEGPEGGQAETSIAVDSTGTHIVIGHNDTRGFGLNPISVSGYLYSDDGGATFTDGGLLPVTTATSTIGSTILPQVFGDPEVKYLGGSTFIYFSIIIAKFGASGAAQTMGVHRSTDYGHTWTGPYEIGPATNPNGLLSGVNASDAADKEFADVDPETGRVLMSWSNFTSTAFAPGGVEISSTFSDDIMAAAGPTWSARSIVSATASDGQASIPRFAAGGSPNVYVAWRRSTGGLDANVGFARSTDNGATFGPPFDVTEFDFKTMDHVLGNDRVNTFPSLAVDNSGGPNQGNVYLVYANNANDDGADIAFQRSLDGGSTFSPPLLINSRPGNDRAQWFPWVTVDSSTGRVYAMYYDQRTPFGGDLTEISVQHSDDAGVSWSKPVSLNDRPFHAGHGNDTGQPNLGDYNQSVAQADELFATFAQTTQPGFTDGLPSQIMTTPDVAFKRIPGFSSKLSLALGQVTFTEPENGLIDRGELASLTFPLANYVTNIINASAVTGISATLSTSTPGVSVVHATRSYPDIEPGATASNIGTFDVQIDQAFVPGAHIEFTLAVAAATGSSTLLFTQSTGTPVAITIFQQDFNGVLPGALPAGWSTSHGGGNNTVPWTTNGTFMGNGTNAAFHQNANDGLAGNHTRFERLFSPLIAVPRTAEFVNLDFDVRYNAEDDPRFNVQAFDGFFLRISDFGPTGAAPGLVRTVLAEAFAEEFVTGTDAHYPKHFPRSSNTAYFEDMSAWSGSSSGVKHVRMKLPGMAGRFFQLRWEFTQDSIGTCADVRPGPCGVAFDTIVITSVTSQMGVRTSTSVVSSQNPSDSGEPVTFTATVSAGSPVTVGEVVFKEGATTLAGPAPVDAGGQASVTTSALTPGNHVITAEYDGPPGFRSSSGQITQVVDPLPTFTIDDVEVAEGDAGTTAATFTVRLSAPTRTVTAQVDFATANGTATMAGNDYTPAAGTLAFPPGFTTDTIFISIVGDHVIEPDETFTVNLSAAVKATIGDGQGVGTIVNDDTVAGTLAALVDQVNAGITSGHRAALLARLVAVERALGEGRPDKAVHALEQFVKDVEKRVEASVAGQLIAEAQSMIGALAS
jgi:hypothetical protein